MRVCALMRPYMYADTRACAYGPTPARARTHTHTHRHRDAPQLHLLHDIVEGD